MLAGCGGSAAPKRQATFGVVGGLSATTVTSTAEIPASPTLRQVTLGGVLVEVPPSSVPLPAGTVFSVLPSGAPVLSSATGRSRTPETRDPNDGPSVTLNGVLDSDPESIFSTEVPINPDLSLKSPLALPAGEYTATVHDVNLSSSTGYLTIGQMGIFFSTNDDGTTSFPAVISGEVPTNGSSLVGLRLEFECRSTLPLITNKVTLAVQATSFSAQVNGAVTQAGDGDFDVRFQHTGVRHAIPNMGLRSVNMYLYTSHRYDPHPTLGRRRPDAAHAAR